MTAERLRARIGRLETMSDAGATVYHAVDRPPRETREEWIARMAVFLRDEHHETGAVNHLGETRTQWTARRKRELGITGIQETVQ